MPYSQKLQMAIGGKWAISWKIAAYVLPFLLIIIPIAEGAVFTWWAFWRWTLVSFISLIPVVIIFFIADITLFKNREKNLDLVYDEFERDIVLIGATSVEDRL